MTIDQAGPPTLGAILAGGLARRLGGGDKPLRIVGGRTILDRLVDRLAPQVARLMLNVNDNPARFHGFGLPLAADGASGHRGPLAGVLAALEWVGAAAPAIEWAVTVPGDTPFIPRDLVARLHAARGRDNATLACAASAGRTHPVVALWPVSIRDELQAAVAEEGIRKVGLFTQRYRCVAVDWPAAGADPFFNVNTLDDLTEANRLIAVDPGL